MSTEVESITIGVSEMAEKSTTAERSGSKTKGRKSTKLDSAAKSARAKKAKMKAKTKHTAAKIKQNKYESLQINEEQAQDGGNESLSRIEEGHTEASVLNELGFKDTEMSQWVEEDGVAVVGDPSEINDKNNEANTEATQLAEKLRTQEVSIPQWEEVITEVADADVMASANASDIDEPIDKTVADESGEEDGEASAEMSSSELEGFDSAEVEEKEFLANDQVISVIESLLFASSKPQSFGMIKQVFKGTQVGNKEVKEAIAALMGQYASPERGVTLEEVASGYQLRTKVDNMDFLRKSVKARVFRLSGPALEVLAITAYKQPCIKMHVDEIRGVESGHLLRGLMERGFVQFSGKSELPGKPMLYATTKKFLETFGLRNLHELPSLSEIEELIPEDIGEEVEESTLDEITDEMSSSEATSYSQGEDELLKITDQLSVITTSTDFFEQEKQRQKNEREAHRAQDLEERELTGETLSVPDRRWLTKYEEKQAAQLAASQAAAELSSNEEPIAQQEPTQSEHEDIMAIATKAESGDTGLVANEIATSNTESVATAKKADDTFSAATETASEMAIGDDDNTASDAENEKDLESEIEGEGLVPWTED